MKSDGFRKICCRTVWFYILLSDHNATDLVLQKKLQFMAQIFLRILSRAHTEL
jgi:hypothetical protein